MFGVFLISAITLMHVYIIWRTSSVPFIQRHVTGKMLFTAGLALWVLVLRGRIYGHDSPGVLAIVLELAGMIWMAIAFLIMVPMLAVDMITVFGMVLPGSAPRIRCSEMRGPSSVRT